MRRTLFLYIFKDLLRIFLLAVGVLSGIMSFGGLLKPLYEVGLNVGQVGQVLTWSTPAMWAYSLPIAALFATTIVYGRLGADNEIIACRAAGISHLAIAGPAMVLGVVTAIISLALLCFIVPASMLKVERIIYSNIAQLVAGQIEQTHQIHFDHANRPVTVFAQGAHVLPIDPKRPRDQAVRLVGPMIVQYEATEKNKPLIPESFFLAKVATAYITQDSDDDEGTLVAQLEGGTKFPRTSIGETRKTMQISVETTRFGPIELGSRVPENTKFMDIFRLRDVYARPEQSRKIRKVLRQFIDDDQQRAYMVQLAAMLNSPDERVVLDGGAEKYVLKRGSAPVEVRNQKLIIGGELGGTPAQLTHVRDNGIDVLAKEIRIRAYPDTDRKRIGLDLDIYDCVVKVAGQESAKANFSRNVNVEMPLNIQVLADRPVSEFLNASLSAADISRLKRDVYKLYNSVISEQHARVSFAVSCVVLVMVGCALGMMFRSGNFLSAFAISVVPALLSIALIVTGQHTAENVPSPIPPNWTNSLQLGLGLIWAGNAVVLAIAVVLLGRLQRQ